MSIAYPNAVKDESWRPQAACLGVGIEAFYPPEDVRGPVRRSHEEKIKKLYCGACPVRTACLGYALASPPEKHGIWGGATEEERQAMRRREQRRLQRAS